MKIAFALGHELPFPPERGGGVNSLLESLTRALAEAGHDVATYSPTCNGRPAREVRDGVEHIRVRGAQRRANNLLNSLAGLPYALALRAALKPCDILSCHLGHSFLLPAARVARVITHTLHRDPKRFLGIYRGLDRIYTASETVSEDARRVAPALAGKVRTVHNCVDFTGYEAPSPQIPKVMRFLFVGRFSRDKGVDVLIRSFAQAARLEPNIHLALVGPLEEKDGGDPGLAAEYRAYIESEGFAGRIEIAPPVFDRAQLDERIRQSDVVCLPSVRGETLNMSIIESMRLGKCLLVSDLSANAPLVKAGWNGVIAKAGDASAWCEQISHLARCREKVAEYGVNAFQHGLASFSAPQIAAEYLRDFADLLNRSTRRIQ